MNIEAYEIVASRVLAGIMQGSREAAISIIFEHGLIPEDMPPTGYFRDALSASLEVLKTPNSAPTAETVWARSGMPTSFLEWLSQVTQGRDINKQEASGAAKELQRYAHRLNNEQILTQALKDNGNDKVDPTNVASFVSSRMAQSRGSLIHDAGISAVFGRFKAKLGQGKYQPVSTNIPWLDMMLNGGLFRERMIAIAASEKNRKSTWLRNIFLGLSREFTSFDDLLAWKVRPDVNLALYAFENSQEVTAQDFLVMLMAEYVFTKYKLAGMNEIHKARPLHEFINAERLQVILDDNKMAKMPNSYQEAYAYAEEGLSRLNRTIFIYDRTREGGYLRDTSDMKRVTNMHMALYVQPTQMPIFGADYLGLVKAPSSKGGTNDAQGQVVEAAMDIIVDHRASVFAVAQLNREAAMNKAKGIEVDVIGTYGSAELEKGAQNYMTVAADYDDPQVMEVVMRRSRRGAAGMDKSWKFRIHPGSGAIIGNYSDTKPLFVIK